MKKIIFKIFLIGLCNTLSAQSLSLRPDQLARFTSSPCFQTFGVTQEPYRVLDERYRNCEESKRIEKIKKSIPYILTGVVFVLGMISLYRKKN